MLHSEHGSFARRIYHLPRVSLCVRSRSRGCSIHATSDTLVASGLDRRLWFPKFIHLYSHAIDKYLGT